jgi:hypothetical protein
MHQVKIFYVDTADTSQFFFIKYPSIGQIRFYTTVISAAAQHTKETITLLTCCQSTIGRDSKQPNTCAAVEVVSIELESHL